MRQEHCNSTGVHDIVCVCVCVCVRVCVLFVHCTYLLYTYQDTVCTHRCIGICTLCVSVLINTHLHYLRL